MLELHDNSPSVDVPDAEYFRLLGYPPGHEPEARALELSAATRRWYHAHGRPWVYLRETNAVKVEAGRVRIHEIEFASAELHEQLAAARTDRVILAALSAGPECEQRARELWQEGKPDEYFFMEVFGSAVVENLVTLATAEICAWAEQNRLTALPHYSPGYSGWDVADQCQLLELIRSLPDAAALPGELSALESGMLRPKKSLLALFGVTRESGPVRLRPGLVPCDRCACSPCPYRRAPYRHLPLQLEDVRRLQANHRKDSLPEVAIPPLDLSGKYSLNPRVLRKWAEDRLHMTFQPDGSVRAIFRYDGTTCSNLGHALSFDYAITLAPPSDYYRVLQAVCVPAAGDLGHKSMCAYQTDGEAFARSLADEQPLLGRPLREVFTWQRHFSPSGCYCDADGRAHKWGQVFEVIHFALAQRTKSIRHGQTLQFVK